MKKVVIYLRVSSSEQTAENQLPALEKWVADRGHKLLEVYQENESAWKSEHQRKLSRLFDDLKHRKIDICLVWALDRLTHEGIAKISEPINRFKMCDVQVINFQE